MKKAICILISVLIILSLAACSGKTNNDTTDASSTEAAVSEVVSESTTEATTESTTESTTASTTESTTAATTKPTTTAPTTEKITTTQKPTEKPTTTAAPTSAAAKADLSAVRKKIIGNLKISDPMSIDMSAIPSLYGIALKDMASAAGFTTFNGAFPEDVIMIEAADSAAKGRITGILNDRLADVKNQSQSYDEENYKLAQSCKVVSNGNYVALFISPSHAEMEKIFLAAVK